MSLEQIILLESAPSLSESSFGETMSLDVPPSMAKRVMFSASQIYDWARENILKHKRMPHASKNRDRLHEALMVYDNLHLEKRTLLDDALHYKHASNLCKRFYKYFGKNLITLDLTNKIGKRFGGSLIGYYEDIAHQKARKLTKFVTVTHSVQGLNPDIALKDVDQLIYEIKKCIREVSGAACLGAVEIEITSIKQGRRVRDYHLSNIAGPKSTIDEDGVVTPYENQKETRKLKSCEILGSHLSDEEINGESGQFIIHFHGIVKANNAEDLNRLESYFYSNPCWTKSSRQVLFKPFTKIYKGVYKTIEHSLSYFSFYITKGGAPKIGENSYLMYNLIVPKDISLTYEEYLNLNDLNGDCSSNQKRQILIDKGNILDFPILSNYEINMLTLVNFGLMNRNKSGTGYIVSVGKW